MSLNIKQLIEDKSGDRDYFAMVPAMLWPDIKLCSGGSEADAAAAHAEELGISLSVHDRWLYVTLKKICGEKGGQCFMSSRGLAKFAGMSVGQLSKSKTQLEQAGLITIVAKKRTAKGWAIDHITVIDVWGQNIGLIKARQQSAHLVSTLEGKCSSHEQKCSPGEQIGPKCSPHERKCSPGETEEEPIEEEPKEEEEPLKKTIDPLLFDLERQTLENNESNYADPAHAGGADALADAALFALYAERGKRPPHKGTKQWAQQRSKVAEALAAYGYEQASLGLVEKAAALLCERKGDWTNVFHSSFPMDFGQALSDAEGAVAQKDRNRAHDVETMKESLAALDERKAAQSAPPQDDVVGANVKAELELQMARHTFLQYIKPNRFTCEDGALVITAPDDFTRDWLENRLMVTIERALAGMADGPGDVVIEVREVSL